MEISDIFHTFAVINTEAMKKEKRYPPVEEEENGLMAGEPAVGSVAYASTSTMSEPDYDFGMKDLGLPRSMDDISVELKEAERELSDQTKWSSLSDFLSDFKQEHVSWLK